MDGMAREFAEEAHFLFVYTREAHPERFPEFPAHRTIEQKFAHARAMCEHHRTPRMILVDDLEGTVHRAYSGCSNMSWIIDHAGHVHFKANWTVAGDLRGALEAAIRIRDLKRDPYTVTVQYFTEGTGYDRIPGGRPAPNQDGQGGDGVEASRVIRKKASRTDAKGI